MTHYNIQISVQRVGEKAPVALRRGQEVPARTRTVIDLLNLKVVATNEEEAYAKAAKMLAAATPESPTGDIEGNPVSGGYEDEEE